MVHLADLEKCGPCESLPQGSRSWSGKSQVGLDIFNFIFALHPIFHWMVIHTDPNISRHWLRVALIIPRKGAVTN